MKPFDPFLNGYYDGSDQLREHLRRRSQAALDRVNEEKAAIRSQVEEDRRRLRLKAAALKAIGGLPDMPSEVNAELRGTIDCGDFSIEKLLIETLPGVWASANLYLPKNVQTPIPGVLFLCGHAREAKAYPEYQQVARALVRSQIAVLAVDPVGQGERLQYLDPETGEEIVHWGTIEHSHAGFQCHVAGFNVARYFVADAMQALTYLAARPEVDESRLGVTGNSGGGTQTSYLTFFESFFKDRLQCSAPFTYITSRDAYMATGQAHDSEQNWFEAIAQGIDYDDLISVHAPKPLMIGAVASDFFCIEGTVESYERLRRVYEHYGAPENLYCVVSPGRHTYSGVLRDQVRRFFRRHLGGEDVALISGLTSYAGPDESPIRAPYDVEPVDEGTLPPEELHVTPRGQVALLLPNARTVFDLNLEAWQRRKVAVQANADTLAERRERLKSRVLAARSRNPLWVRELRTGVDEETGIGWAHRFTLSEPGIALPMIELWADGAKSSEEISVVGLDEGTLAVSSRRDDVVDLVKERGRILLFDPRGTGATLQRPINARIRDGFYGTFYKLNYDAMMLGDSLFGMWAFDALRTLEYAHRVARRVHVVGEGTAGLVLLAAAVVDDQVVSGTFRKLIDSFESIVTERFFKAHGALEVFDLLSLPDVREMLSLLPEVDAAEFVDGRGEPVDGSGDALERQAT